MAGKKDFSSLDKRVSRVAAALDSATGKRGQQATADEEEQAQRIAAGRTQGRKGCHKGGSRINLLLTPENHKFVNVMARATGHTQTAFINKLITAYRREHPEFLKQAEGFLNFINSGMFSDKEE